MELINVDDWDVNEAQRTAAGLAVRGFSNARIARKLQKNTKTINEWANKDWWKPLCEYYRIKALGDPIVMFEPFLEDALQVYYDVLSNPNAKDGDKIKVAQDVINRIAGKPIERHQVEEKRDVVIEIITSGRDAGEVIEGEYRVLGSLRSQLDS